LFSRIALLVSSPITRDLLYALRIVAWETPIISAACRSEYKSFATLVPFLLKVCVSKCKLDLAKPLYDLLENLHVVHAGAIVRVVHDIDDVDNLDLGSSHRCVLPHFDVHRYLQWLK
jgi:hypothetical protein